MTVWRVTVDRYGDESRAKSESGEVFSVMETAELLVQKYREQKRKPRIEVVTVGIGMALSDYLIYKKIPHIMIKGLLTRVGSADLLQYKEI